MPEVFERADVKVTGQIGTKHFYFPAVRVDERGLLLDGTLVLPRTEIASVTLAFGERTSVYVAGPKKLKRVGLGFTFSDPADANALVIALGRDAERTTVEIELEPSLLTRGFEPLSWWAGLGVVGFVLLALLTLYPSLLLGARGARAAGAGAPPGPGYRTLDIGADGLRIRGMIGDGFVGYDQITGVEARDGAIVIQRRVGPEIKLPVSQASRLEEAVLRIERALATRDPVDHEVGALLRDVPGTKVAAIAALRELGDVSTTSYRTARIPRERLLGVVEDPRANGHTRARAAVALSGALDDDERARLRVAADVTVSPRVRIALEAASTASDRLLAARLGRLREEDDEEQEARRVS